MAKSAWSTKKPTKPGRWWMRYPDRNPAGEPILVDVERRERRLWASGIGIKWFPKDILWQPVQPPLP